MGINTFGLIGETDREAKETFFPGWMHLFNRASAERGWARPTAGQFEAMCARAVSS